MNKIKLYKILLLLLILATVIVSILVAIKYIGIYKNEKKTKQVIMNISEALQGNDDVTTEINEQIQGYKVVGIIKIPK